MKLPYYLLVIVLVLGLVELYRWRTIPVNQVNRYQIVSGKFWLGSEDISGVFKIDTITGQTWMLNFPTTDYPGWYPLSVLATNSVGTIIPQGK